MPNDTSEWIWAYVNVPPYNAAIIPAPVFGQVAIEGTLTTSSSTFVDMAGISITLNTSGRDVELAFNTTVYASAATSAAFDFTVRGRRTIHWCAWASRQINGIVMTRITAAGIDHCAASGPVRVTGLSAGSHTFKVQWRSTAGVLDERPFRLDHDLLCQRGVAVRRIAAILVFLLLVAASGVFGTSTHSRDDVQMVVRVQAGDTATYYRCSEDRSPGARVTVSGA